ncbi:MAG: hypothetical protein SCJ93_06440 [Bacillota bacterium]|nr:hypothetical protein [Bacillota bacterium]
MSMLGFNIFSSFFGLIYLVFLGISIYVLILIINLIRKGTEALDVYIKKNKY